LLVATLLAQASWSLGAENITPSCSFERGAINGVLVDREEACLAVYGWSNSEANNIQHVLLPHGRRDLLWKARPLLDVGAEAIAPERARYFLEQPGDFWKAFTVTRFHDYGQQSTKICAEPLPVERWVKEGDEIRWQKLTLRVLDTPGYTRGSASYITELDGKKVAFTGDLIYGDGKILDLYSFQDSIDEAKIRGYHGYGSRLAGLVASLHKVADEQPDVLVPARGPVIRDPQEAIAKLVRRVQALYRNYLSTSALHWYFGKERMEMCGRRVLGPGADVELMPLCRHEATPDWVFEHSTSRLLVSEDGHGFLLDCGYQRVIDAVEELISQGVLKDVEGIFVTHFHDDHTDFVQTAAETFQCPVYATREYSDVLEHPEAYHLPALTPNPVRKVTVMGDGQRIRWHEFELTFHFFPGQTLYHGALLAKKEGEKPILFIGDSFAPSGIDDYCVLNRNLVHEDSGYLRCLTKLRAEKEDFWLVNEHIRHVFAFSPSELEYLERRYRARIELLRELFPWDDPNYGIDEQWAVFYPRGAALAPGATREFELRITNHSPVERTFEVTVHAAGLKLKEPTSSITLPARQSGAVAFHAQSGSAPGNYLITADIRSDGMEFRRWTEALVTVE
jgi:glyoxylase-like metal-dependent hydrolase (beta-lactamase superfamily II)